MAKNKQHLVSVPQDLYEAAVENAENLNRRRLSEAKIAVEEFQMSKEILPKTPITWQQAIRSQFRATMQFQSIGLYSDEISNECLVYLEKIANGSYMFPECYECEKTPPLATPNRCSGCDMIKSFGS